MREVFERNIKDYKSSIQATEKQLNTISIARVVSFISSIIIIIVLADRGLVTSLFLAIPLLVLVFGMLTKRYNQVVYQKKHLLYLIEVNESEIERLFNKLADTGQVSLPLNRTHFYAADLDIFGAHSLYGLLNRTTTESGCQLLAEWLSEPASKPIVLERQQAAKELSPKIAWRQEFQASGMHYTNAKSDYNRLLTWAETPVRLLPKTRYYLILSIVMAVLTTSSGFYYFIHAFSSDWYVYFLPFGLFLAINYRIIKSVKPIAEEIIDSTHRNVKTLKGYSSLITSIQSGIFESGLLKRLQSELKKDNQDAAYEIRKLSQILGVFQLRGTKLDLMGGNKFYPPINLMWLIDIYWILQTEKWKEKNRPYLSDWINVTSEFEALNSLAGYTYANPDYVFPEIKDEPYQISFKSLGHPLINSEKRVSSDFQLCGQGEIGMITGSNMAGKSTFLRAVGINLVLALTGAPCCARSGSISHMKIFTSMRTEDNLEEGVSSFYAELQRIEQLLKLIQSGEPIFFLLDEMFKGTNSKDRYKGGVSLVKQLNELNAFGLISTHDLELAKLSGDHIHMSNYSFNSRIVNGEMTFDYALTNGICKDFNASELMKRSGIKILSEFD